VAQDFSRRSVLALAGGALLAGATGCAALTPAGTGPRALLVHSSLGGTSPGADVFAEAVARFRAAQPDMELAVVTNGSDLPIVYETSRLAGKEADVVMVNLVGNQLSWTELDATVPVQGYLRDWGLEERVLPASRAEWTASDGDLRAFPYFASTWPVAYNTALLEQAGVKVPATAEELVATARALRAAGVGPVTVGGSDWTGQKLFCQIIQAYVTPDEAAQFFTTGDLDAHPDVARGIAHFVQLRDEGVFVDQAQGLTSDLMTSQYNSGRAGMQMAMTSALAKTPAEVAATTTVGGWPLPADAVHPHPTMMRGYSVLGLWISPSGQEKIDLVERFVRYLYQEDVAAEFVERSGRDLALVTDARSDAFPLVAAAQRLTADDVTEVLLPDLSVPTQANEPLIQAAGLAFAPGSTAERIGQALVGAYRQV
jgi:multiple sugar transport system substrate-binding protein